MDNNSDKKQRSLFLTVASVRRAHDPQVSRTSCVPDRRKAANLSLGVSHHIPSPA